MNQGTGQVHDGSSHDSSLAHQEEAHHVIVPMGGAGSAVPSAAEGRGRGLTRPRRSLLNKSSTQAGNRLGLSFLAGVVVTALLFLCMEALLYSENMTGPSAPRQMTVMETHISPDGSFVRLAAKPAPPAVADPAASVIAAAGRVAAGDLLDVENEQEQEEEDEEEDEELWTPVVTKKNKRRASRGEKQQASARRRKARQLQQKKMMKRKRRKQARLAVVQADDDYEEGDGDFGGRGADDDDDYLDMPEEEEEEEEEDEDEDEALSQQAWRGGRGGSGRRAGLAEALDHVLSPPSRAAAAPPPPPAPPIATAPAPALLEATAVEPMAASDDDTLAASDDELSPPDYSLQQEAEQHVQQHQDDRKPTTTTKSTKMKSPPSVSEQGASSSAPAECRGQWVEETRAILRKYDTFRRLDNVCFDYKRDKVYALTKQAEADIPELVRRETPFPYAGVLPTALASNNRTRHVTGTTLFLRTKHDGMHGRWDHLLQWASTVFPLSSARFTGSGSAWARALRQLDKVMLYGVAEQDFFDEKSRWMREVLDAVLDYAALPPSPSSSLTDGDDDGTTDDDRQRAQQQQGEEGEGGTRSNSKKAPERVFLTVDRMRKQPIMCFERVLVSTPCRAATVGEPGGGGGNSNIILSKTAARAQQRSMAVLGGGDNHHRHVEDMGHSQPYRRPWKFFPTPCAAEDLRRFLLHHFNATGPATLLAGGGLPSHSQASQGVAPLLPPLDDSEDTKKKPCALLLLRTLKRGWLNEEAIVDKTRDYLQRDKGWQVRVMHSDSTTSEAGEMIRAVSGARLLVSQHGSQLVNMVFLPHGASVIEVVSADCTTTTTTTSEGGSSSGGGGGASSSGAVYARLAAESGLRLVRAQVGSPSDCRRKQQQQQLSSHGGGGVDEKQKQTRYHMDFDAALMPALQQLQEL